MRKINSCWANALLCYCVIVLLFGCATIAEGIETPEELATLREIGVSLGQGYLFSPPKSLSEPPE